MFQKEPKVSYTMFEKGFLNTRKKSRRIYEKEMQPKLSFDTFYADMDVQKNIQNELIKSILGEPSLLDSKRFQNKEFIRLTNHLEKEKDPCRIDILNDEVRRYIGKVAYDEIDKEEFSKRKWENIPKGTSDKGKRVLEDEGQDNIKSEQAEKDMAKCLDPLEREMLNSDMGGFSWFDTPQAESTFKFIQDNLDDFLDEESIGAFLNQAVILWASEREKSHGKCDDGSNSSRDKSQEGWSTTSLKESKEKGRVEDLQKEVTNELMAEDSSENNLNHIVDSKMREDHSRGDSHSPVYETDNSYHESSTPEVEMKKSNDPPKTPKLYHRRPRKVKMYRDYMWVHNSLTRVGDSKDQYSFSFYHQRSSSCVTLKHVQKDIGATPDFSPNLKDLDALPDFVPNLKEIDDIPDFVPNPKGAEFIFTSIETDIKNSWRKKKQRTHRRKRKVDVSSNGMETDLQMPPLHDSEFVNHTHEDVLEGGENAIFVEEDIRPNSNFGGKESSSAKRTKKKSHYPHLEIGVRKRPPPHQELMEDGHWFEVKRRKIVVSDPFFGRSSLLTYAKTPWIMAC